MRHFGLLPFLLMCSVLPLFIAPQKWSGCKTIKFFFFHFFWSWQYNFLKVLFFPSSVGVTMSCFLLCTCLPGLHILVKLYVKYQCCFDVQSLSWKCIWLCLQLPMGRIVVSVFWEFVSQFIILNLARIKSICFLNFIF